MTFQRGLASINLTNSLKRCSSDSTRFLHSRVAWSIRLHKTRRKYSRGFQKGQVYINDRPEGASLRTPLLLKYSSKSSFSSTPRKWVSTKQYSVHTHSSIPVKSTDTWTSWKNSCSSELQFRVNLSVNTPVLRPAWFLYLSFGVGVLYQTFSEQNKVYETPMRRGSLV